MSLPKSPKPSWSKTDLNLIYKYKERIKDIEKDKLEKSMLTKDVDSIDFYNITPKEKLPKFLQKMKFQTLHSKQNAGRDVKVFKKERQSADKINVRRKLKTAGNIMFISEIYQSLGESLQPRGKGQWLLSSKSSQSFGMDLQQWQKARHTAVYQKLLLYKRRTNLHKKQSRIIQQKLSQLHRRNTTGRVVNYFKQGSNYKKQIQKQLDIIYNKHSQQPNQMNMYVLIQNSSKLLKKELDERYSHVEGEMKVKLRVLNDTRIQHHNLFEERTKLGVEERQYAEELLMKEQQQHGMPSPTTTSSSYFSTPTAAKLTQLKALKKAQIQQIQSKIMKNKLIIEQLQLGIQHSEQQLMAIMVGEVAYYKMSLRVGLDCRDSGLGWILKRLGELVEHREYSKESGKESKDSNFVSIAGSGGSSNYYSNISTALNHPQFAPNQQSYEFPLYLDKKSKQFLILKTYLQNQLQHLMQQKRKFVTQIAHSASGQIIMTSTQNSPSRVALKNSISMSGLQTTNSMDIRDRVMESDQVKNEGGISKKYRMSMKKMTTLNQQYAHHQSLLQMQQRKLSPSSKKLQLSTNTDGLTGKRLYQTITQKIKFFDFAKAKKDKFLQLKNSKLMQYQNLLKSIKDIHTKLQDMDIQHENHLISHYKDSKEMFFQQCAACFGYKKTFSMIIKYFSWKNASEENNATTV